jgi:hypothetical protein
LALSHSVVYQLNFKIIFHFWKYYLLLFQTWLCITNTIVYLVHIFKCLFYTSITLYLIIPYHIFWQLKFNFWYEFLLLAIFIDFYLWFLAHFCAFQFWQHCWFFLLLKFDDTLIKRLCYFRKDTYFLSLVAWETTNQEIFIFHLEYLFLLQTKSIINSNANMYHL